MATTRFAADFNISYWRRSSLSLVRCHILKAYLFVFISLHYKVCLWTSHYLCFVFSRVSVVAVCIWPFLPHWPLLHDRCSQWTWRILLFIKGLNCSDLTKLVRPERAAGPHKFGLPRLRSSQLSIYVEYVMGCVGLSLKKVLTRTRVMSFSNIHSAAIIVSRCKSFLSMTLFTCISCLCHIAIEVSFNKEMSSGHFCQDVFFF